MTTQRFYRTVLSAANELDLESAKRSTAAVLHALRDRLTPGEADHAAAQLPIELKEVWRAGEGADRRPRRTHRHEFLLRVQREAGLASSLEAQRVTLAVFAALKEQLSPGEAGDVFAQLPKGLKQLWTDAQA
jgi:uncharacterized protein (DUF2267 family)